MRGLLSLAGLAIVVACVVGLYLFSGFTPAPNPNFTNIQLPTLDQP